MIPAGTNDLHEVLDPVPHHLPTSTFGIHQECLKPNRKIV